MEEKLIELVRCHEILFNVKCVEYRDQNKRQEAWEEIGSKLNIKAEKAKETWERLRRCFNNVLRRRLKKNRLEGRQITPWKYEQQMSFLVPFLEPRELLTKLEDLSQYQESAIEHRIHYEDDSNLREDDEHSNCQEAQCIPQLIYQEDQQFQNLENQDCQPNQENILINVGEMKRCKRDRSKREDVANEMIEILKENALLRSMKCEDRSAHQKRSDVLENLDETDLFFLSMSKMMKKLPKMEQTNIKLLLSNTVLEAEKRSEEKFSVND